MIKFNPQYNAISDYIHLSENSATRRINAMIKEENKFKTTFENLIKDFQDEPDKKEVLEFIDGYIDEMADDDFIFGGMYDPYGF